MIIKFNPAEWPTAHRILFIASLNCLLILGGYFSYLNPIIVEYHYARTLLIDLNQQLSLKTREHIAVVKKYKELQKIRNQYAEYLVTQDKISLNNLISKVVSFLQQHSLQLLTIKPEIALNNKTSLRTLMIEKFHLETSGEYISLLCFIHQLIQSKWIINIQNLELQLINNSLEAQPIILSKMDIECYYPIQ